MEIAGIFMLLIQIGFAVHAIRRGYSLFWVFLIIFVPLIGCILYTVMVLLPEAKDSRVARQASKAVRTGLVATLDPKRELKKRREQLELSNTVANRIGLAKEYLKHGMPEAAIELYESSLTGMYRTDPDLLLGLATALVDAKRFDKARETLDTLIRANPGFESPEARLLYARTLEELGEMERALEEYAALARYSSGPETKCRHALLLKRLGRTAEAKVLFEEILKDAKGTTRHSYRLNKEWVEMAKREMG